MKNSFVINSVASCKQISQSPLNHSLSKNLWSFCKQERFKLKKSQCDSFYNLPSMIKKKGPGFGFGNKSDFTKDMTSSPGTKYNLKTFFDQNKSYQKGYSMSLGRNDIPSKGHIPLDPLKVPSPNRYQNLKINPSPSFTMREKTRTLDLTMSIEPQNTNPGAGQYENPEKLSLKGNYIISKFQGTKATRFNPRSSKRFFQIKPIIPGPGTYNEINNISNEGYYPLSTSNGFGKRYFDKEKRIIDFQRKASKNKNPDPGFYRQPSQFGHYDHQRNSYNSSFGNMKKSRTSFDKFTSYSSKKKP